MRTISKIITKLNCTYGAPMGRRDVGPEPDNDKTKVFDARVPLDGGGYDRGGAYWGHGSPLRVRYTKDLSFIRFYRA